MRKLASIQKVLSVSPIEGADRIEVARVLGWDCVIKKGEFRPGDLAVYFEIDSFLPVRPEFEFLRASSYRKSDLLGEGFRLRTAKLRGQVSQGLLLPVSIVEEKGWHGLPEGTDVTELLGIRKWEIEEFASSGGTIVGTLPGGVPKTDETRIQAEPGLLAEFAGLPYYISTKMDGSSHSISLDAEGVFHVTGHNYEYKDDGKSSFYELVKARGLEAALRALALSWDARELAVQGELCAPGIQRNRLRLAAPEWYVFTVIADGRRVGLRRMLEACAALGAAHVPIEEEGVDLPSKYPDADAILARAEGQYPNGGPKEGIVIRPTEPVRSKILGGDLSMKAVSNRYLLKGQD